MHREEDGSSVELCTMKNAETAAAPLPAMVGGGGADSPTNLLTDLLVM